jgi:hypothetical protein
LTQAELALWARNEFNLVNVPTQPTISGLLKKRDQYLNMPAIKINAKKCRPVLCPELEEILIKWVVDAQHRGIAVSDETIVEKAKQLAKEFLKKKPDMILPEFKGNWVQIVYLLIQRWLDQRIQNAQSSQVLQVSW